MPLSKIKTVVIAAGASLSGEVDLDEFRIAAILMPAAWTAASITCQAAEKSGGTYRNVYDDGGAEVAVTTAASRAVVLTGAEADAISGLRWVKLRSGTSGTPVNQDAERTIYVVLK